MAFTLAEILIMITIIGIVAAMTIPALIQKTQKKEYSTRLVQTYSMLSQAAALVKRDGWKFVDDYPWQIIKQLFFVIVI